MHRKDTDFITKTCPICGKEFIIPNVIGWVYKGKYRKKFVYCCSYSCFKKMKRSNYTLYDVYKNGELIGKDKTISELELLGLHVNYIHECVRKNKPCKGYMVKVSKKKGEL